VFEQLVYYMADNKPSLVLDILRHSSSGKLAGLLTIKVNNEQQHGALRSCKTLSFLSLCRKRICRGSRSGQ
jgi:hypothetical protein